VHSRQRLIPGFDVTALWSATVTVMGLGASSIAVRWLVRKGLGHLKAVDPDIVSLSNYPRQEFTPQEVASIPSPRKVFALGERLVREAPGPLVVEAYAHTVQEAVALGADLSCDVGVCLVDSDAARLFCARWFRAQHTPLLVAGFSPLADRGYVFVQAGEAGADAGCLCCLFPELAGSDRFYRCAAQTADLPLVMGGLLLYAVDSLVMGRPRDWNYREVGLGSGVLDVATQVPSRPGCPLCGGSGAT
jgi:molybdopterin/thiamine biosynthesis adenylyltransferase